jgi:hypothetical protein
VHRTCPAICRRQEHKVRQALPSSFVQTTGDYDLLNQPPILRSEDAVHDLMIAHPPEWSVRL